MTKAIFHTGTWPYVGIRYGQAEMDGARVKILFVAMERGSSFDPRVEPEFADTQRNFRQSMLEHGNPHMAGVSVLMSRLVDDNDPQRRSEQFALTNAVKCVWFTGNMTSTSSRTMIDNCSRHLRQEIDFFAPDLIVTQGRHPGDTLTSLRPDLRVIESFSWDRRKATVLRNGELAVLMC